MQLADHTHTEAEEGFGTEDDRHTIDLKLANEHVEIIQILWVHFQGCYPALSLCHAKTNTTKRAFFNVIETGMPPQTGPPCDSNAAVKLKMEEGSAPGDV